MRYCDLLKYIGESYFKITIYKNSANWQIVKRPLWLKTLLNINKVYYLLQAHINLGKKGYLVPRVGTIQVTLLNPLGTVIKMFVVMYNLTDMPNNSHTFLRQRTLYMPNSIIEPLDNSQKYLRYLIHLR